MRMSCGENEIDETWREERSTFYTPVCLSITSWFILCVLAAGTKGYTEACNSLKTFVWDLMWVSLIWRWLGDPAARLFSHRPVNKRSSPASLLLSVLLLSFPCSLWTITPSCPQPIPPPLPYFTPSHSFRSVPFIVWFAVIQVVTAVQCEASLRPRWNTLERESVRQSFTFLPFVSNYAGGTWLKTKWWWPHFCFTGPRSA